MEFVYLLVCLLPCGLVPLLGLAVWAGIDAGRRNRRRAEAQRAVLEAIGLERVAGAAWCVGTIAGRPVAVKAQRAARVDNNAGSGGSVALRVTLVALFPIDVPLAEHLFQNTPGRGEKTFERHYYGDGGRPPMGLSPALQETLLAWALEAPEDDVELGPRRSPHLYAGDRFPDARALVRVTGAGREASDAVQTWLEACAARVTALETAAT